MSVASNSGVTLPRTTSAAPLISQSPVTDTTPSSTAYLTVAGPAGVALS